MKLPEDPFMLFSMVNMKLRDGEYDSFTDFCLSNGINESELIDVLHKAGFDYDEKIKQFR